jgi:O-antigen ligase
MQNNLYEEIAMRKAAKQLKRAVFFMTYPFWMLFQNISFYFIILFVFRSYKLRNPIFKVRSVMSYLSILFMIGVTASTISAGINLGYEYFSYAIKVLPFYLYWGALVIVLGNLTFVTINIEDLFQKIFWGVIFSIITYFFLREFFKPIYIYRNVTQNSFAFLLICFSPIATAYVYHKTKNLTYTIIFILFIVISGFASGSRSGSLLTLLGCSLVISTESWLRLTIVLFTGLALYIAAPQIIQNSSVKATVFKLNERTYDLLYETEETLTTDRSYLTRLAMIEKGLNIFEKYPIAGIGIDNFSKKQFDIDFDFEGAEFIEGKEEFLESSTNPHNSYISFLSEGGLLLFIPAVLLMFYPIFYLIANYNNINPLEKALFIGVIFMCIHSWFIASMLNVFGWFLLGIVNSLMTYRRK